MCLREVCCVTGWPAGHLYVRSGSAAPELISSTVWHLVDRERFRLLWLSQRAARVVPDHGLIGRAVASAAPVWAGNLASDDALLRTDEAAISGLRAVLADRLTHGPSAAVDQVLMACLRERERIPRAGWFS